MTHIARCDDHDIHAVVVIGFVKPKSQKNEVGGDSTLQNHIVDGIGTHRA